MKKPMTYSNICSLFFRMISVFAIVSAAFLPMALAPGIALANENENSENKSPYMTELDMSNFVNSAQGDDSKSLMPGGVQILQMISTAIMLPIAILVCAWRTLYLATFPLMAHSDPLKMMGKTSFKNADVLEKFKNEFWSMVKAVTIVLSLWVVFQILMWIVVIVLGAVH